MDVQRYLRWSRAACRVELSKYELFLCDYLAQASFFSSLFALSGILLCFSVMTALFPFVLAIILSSPALFFFFDGPCTYFFSVLVSKSLLSVFLSQSLNFKCSSFPLSFTNMPPHCFLLCKHASSLSLFPFIPTYYPSAPDHGTPKLFSSPSAYLHSLWFFSHFPFFLFFFFGKSALLTSFSFLPNPSTVLHYVMFSLYLKSDQYSFFKQYFFALLWQFWCHFNMWLSD